MKIQRLGYANDSRYPYKIRIEVPRDNLTLIETVQEWADNINFKCVRVPGAVYVEEEKDALLFALTWS